VGHLCSRPLSAFRCVRYWVLAARCVCCWWLKRSRSPWERSAQLLQFLQFGVAVVLPASAFFGGSPLAANTPKCNAAWCARVPSAAASPLWTDGPTHNTSGRRVSWVGVVTVTESVIRGRSLRRKGVGKGVAARVAIAAVLGAFSGRLQIAGCPSLRQTLGRTVEQAREVVLTTRRYRIPCFWDVVVPRVKYSAPQAGY
jgi:hypothetical protein